MKAFKQIGQKFQLGGSIYKQELINELEDEDSYLKNASSGRTYTDVPFLIAHGVLLIVLAFLLGYCIYNGDIDRITKGFDDCGNVCGKINNFKIDHPLNCQAQDMSDKPFLSINGDFNECVASCKAGTELKGHFCVPQDSTIGKILENDQQLASFVNGFLKNLHSCSNEIVYLCLIVLGCCITLLLILRYAAAAFVWFSLVGSVVASTVTALYFWNLRNTVDSDVVFCLAIVFSVLATGQVILIVVLRKRISLVIQLIEEAGKSVIAIPMLFFQPVLTFVALVVLWSAWFYFTLWIASAGIPTTNLFGKMTFESNTIIDITFWFNIFVMLWMIQFIYGCQNMLIAGAVSAWYFARDKSRLGSPIFTSAYNMIKYHLGTISVSSLIITIIQFIRVLLTALRRPMQYAVCAKVCLDYAERWMKYFTKNACIVTSIHGHNFHKAGGRAFQLIVENVLRVTAITSIGDFVLALSKILILVSVVAIGHFMIMNKTNIDENHQWLILVLVGIVTYMIAHCFFSVYEHAIDTIFICFCEDCEMNDGVMRPYFMSTNLMAFMDRSKSVLKI